MARRRHGRLTLDNFVGGINLRDDPTDMEPIESPYVVNFRPYGQEGAIVERNGESASVYDFAADSTYLGVVQPIARLSYANAADRFVFFTGAGKVITDKPGVSTVTIFTPAGSGIRGSNAAWFVEAPVSGAQGPLYFRASDPVGTDVLKQSSTTAAAGNWTAASGTLPTTRWYLYIGNRVWAFGLTPNQSPSPTNDSFIWWSDLGDPCAWPAANALKLSPGDGEQFTGGGRVSEVFVVFKRTKAWVIYDLDTGANRPLGENVGAKAMDTICTTPSGLFFIDPQRGPMLTNGSQTWLLPNGTKADWGNFAGAFYYNDHVYCWTTSGGGLMGFNTVWDYDLRTQSWWPHAYGAQFMMSTTTGVNAGIWAARITAAQAKVDIFMYPGSYTDTAGAQIAGEWRSIPFSLGSPENKRLTRAFVRGSGTMLLDAAPDYGSSFTLGGASKVVADNASQAWPSLGVAPRPQFRIRGQASGTRDRLDSLVVDYTGRQK